MNRTLVADVTPFVMAIAMCAARRWQLGAESLRHQADSGRGSRHLRAHQETQQFRVPSTRNGLQPGLLPLLPRRFTTSVIRMPAVHWRWARACR